MSCPCCLSHAHTLDALARLAGVFSNVVRSYYRAPEDKPGDPILFPVYREALERLSCQAPPACTCASSRPACWHCGRFLSEGTTRAGHCGGCGTPVGPV